MTLDNRSRLTAADFAPEVLKLFDQYVHGQIDRRGFLDSAAKYSVGGATAAGLLAALSPRFAEAQQVRPEDPRVQGQQVSWASPKGHGTAHGYLVRPARAAAGSRLPLVLVIHENRGLNPHIEDIARRLALDGFIALAPDALHPLGGYPGDEDKARDLFAKLEQPKAHEDFVAAAEYLRGVAGGNGRLGTVGFCYGGGIVNLLATRLPDLNAAVPFYGPVPQADAVARIKAPMLLHYAGNDSRINAGWPGFEAALKAAQVPYEAHIYPGVEHGFNNDTTPRFDAQAAGQAWTRTVAFFRRHLDNAG
jgi:carboxymethylenebutenolidase